MDILENLKARAKRHPESIVFPEGTDDRIIRASAQMLKEGIAYPVLLGNPHEIGTRAAALGMDLDGIKVVDPANSPERIEEYVDLYRRTRMTSEKIARRLVGRPLYFGGMMTRAGEVAGGVAGVANLTATEVRAAQLTVGLMDGISIPSSFFIMVMPNPLVGEHGALIYADAGVNPDPTAEELAEIAILAARNAETLFDWTPRVAMLSYSTKGSAAGRLVDKVLDATKIANEKAPDLDIDGEFQLDTAVDVEVAARKLKMGREELPEFSRVAGRANILIFPDLNAGNIGYKITQYLAGAQAYGPILQGFRKPMNDLSRGASVQDIIVVTAITVVQSQGGNRRLSREGDE